MSNDILSEKMTSQHDQILRRKRFQARVLENWWAIATLVLAIYIGLPFAAPVLMKTGATGPGNAIYSAYSFLCHQFAFRSIFLFGEQAVYPRESTGTSLKTFEEEAAQSPTFIAIYQKERGDEFEAEFNPNELKTWSRALQMASRKFRGDEVMGYKIALCQRDVAIYLAMVVAGVIYGFVHKRLRPAPLWLYVLLGIAPIALDGFSQLLGYAPFNFWEPRETQPLFRIITGALFGLMNVWLAFPYINSGMQESARKIRASIKESEQKIEALVAKTKSALQ